MTNKNTFLILTILVSLAGLFTCCQSRPAPESTYGLRHQITDYANILTAEQEDSLMAIIKDLELTIGSQIAILTIPELEGQRIEDFSLQTAVATGIGREKFNDGVLITVAYFDSQVRIEVGTGLENILKDEVATKIIREDMVPEFKRQKFASGLYAAVQSISQLIKENEDKVGEEPTLE